MGFPLVSASLTIRQAIEELNRSGKQILLVVSEDGRLIGTITDGDIRRGILRGLSLDDGVDKVMNRSPKFLRQGYSRRDAVAMFMRYRVSRIPVVDEMGRVVDLLLIEDFVENGDKASLPTVVIMAGGKGTRLDPFTKILPKPLIPLGDRPILQVIMDRFYEQGADNFILTLGYKAEIIKLWLEDTELPYSVHYIVEDAPLGTAGSLRNVVEEFSLNGDFIVSNCDVLVDADFRKILDFHRGHKADATVVGYLMQSKLPYGVIQTDGPDFVGMKEKPYVDALVNTGIYVLSADAIKESISAGEVVDMPVVLERIRKKGGRVVVYPHHGQFFDVGQWEVYRETLRRMGY